MFTQPLQTKSVNKKKDLQLYTLLCCAVPFFFVRTPIIYKRAYTHPTAGESVVFTKKSKYANAEYRLQTTRWRTNFQHQRIQHLQILTFAHLHISNRGSITS